MVTSVTALRGVGVHVSQQLARLDIHSIEDLLFHLPLRYQDRTQITPIKALQVGETALIEGTVQAAEIKKGKKTSLICMFNDGSGTMMLRFFHFTRAQREQLQVGVSLRCFGEVRQGYHCLELVHPEYRHAREPIPLDEHLTPVYPHNSHLSQHVWRSLISQALTEHPIIDYFPESLLIEFNWLPLLTALRIVHHPPPETDVEQLKNGIHPAQQRLAFEELLAHHLSLRNLRIKAYRHPAPVLNGQGELVTIFLSQLSFQLTNAQQRAVAEIATDLRAPHPMHRLLQGDVGSGKTVVAALSALQAIEAGYQVAVMAPTELLAEQHVYTFATWLNPLNITVNCLTGSLTKKQKQQVLADIATGQNALTIGTHALFQEGVTFAQLGLVIVDEQHRFGVHQRLALRDKGNQQQEPHQLIMTATPIPRTLAMTVYADLDVSTIDELPPGRTPVNTAIVPNTRRPEVIARISEVCRIGRQAYWVCPLVEESEVLQLQAAEEAARELTTNLPELSIGLVHGRMKSKEKEQVMTAFKNGQLHLLVATTVIEVGMDVPNASLMIIENAERLGLAQLHQLRGRVGRGAIQSYCVLLYQPPLSTIAQARLAILRDTNDGFMIAQRDLELRGPGEVLGTRQTGELNLKIADLQRDKTLFTQVVHAGEIMTQHHPEQCPLLIQRWVKGGARYGSV